MTTPHAELLREARLGLACAIMWALTERGGYGDIDEKYYRWAKAVVDETTEDHVNRDILDRAIAAVDSALAAPTVEGWKWVPVSPTVEMIEEGTQHVHRWHQGYGASRLDVANAYKAMLSAVSSAPQQASGVKGGGP